MKSGVRSMKCRVCKCTWEQPCNPPCAWAPPAYGNLCTACLKIIVAVADWLEVAHRPSVAALIREAREARDRR
jgi:hypothetical protein